MTPIGEAEAREIARGLMVGSGMSFLWGFRDGISARCTIVRVGFDANWVVVPAVSVAFQPLPPRWGRLVITCLAL